MASTILRMGEIEEALGRIDPLPLMEAGFVAFSEARAVVPPVGELIFDAPPGDSHIKYGFVRGDDVFLVKIANYFPDNPKHGKAADDGVVILFDQRTGALRATLVDHGYLTHVRTAAAGAVAAKYLGPRVVERIGIIGTGAQARHQLLYLKRVTGCRAVSVYGRDREKARAYQIDMRRQGMDVKIAASPRAIAERCNLIVTCTSARQPLLMVDDVRPGTHITAMGSDSGEKQELDPLLLQRADVLAVDSIAHASALGELHHALDRDCVRLQDVRELGRIVRDPSLGRTDDAQITVVDLVGLAVQDIQIAKAVLVAGA